MGIDEEKRKAYDSAYYKANRIKILERKKHYYKANSRALKLKAKRYRVANSDTVALKQKLYQLTNRDRIRKYRALNNDSLATKYKRLIRNAKKRKLIIEVSFEDYVITVKNNPCHYCKGELPLKGYGLDRIDNLKGYKVNNIVPCCSDCNVIRSNKLSYEETKVVIKALMKYRNKQAKGE